MVLLLLRLRMKRWLGIPVWGGVGPTTSAFLSNWWPVASEHLYLPLSRESLTALLVQEGMA